MAHQLQSALIRLKIVRAKTGKGRSSIYDDVKRGRFPAPVKIGPRASAWVEEEVDRWIADRIKQSRTSAS